MESIQARALCMLLLSLHATGMEMAKIMRTELGPKPPSKPSSAKTTTTTTTSREDTIFINYGGGKRHDSPDGHGVYRPEAVHSETCDPVSKVCNACDAITACWHGVDPDSMNQHNALAINVAAGIPKKEHVAIIWASCSSDTGYWKLYVQQEKNGQIGVFLNGQPATRVPGQWPLYPFTSDQIGANAQIKIVFLPNDPGQNGPQASSARVLVMAQANAWVEVCMDRNFCLNRLGQGTSASFELRNNIRRQYECLRGNPAAHLTGVCSQWRVCFAGQSDGANHEAELLTYLSVVFGDAGASTTVSSPGKVLADSSSLEEADSLQKKTTEAAETKDQLGCTDPAAEDAEAFECECLEDVTSDCEAADPPVEDIEVCIKTWMCNEPRICDSWKRTGDNCAGTLLERRSNMTLKASGTLDDSVTGKCTSSTRGL